MRWRYASLAAAAAASPFSLFSTACCKTLALLEYSPLAALIMPSTLASRPFSTCST